MRYKKQLLVELKYKDRTQTQVYPVDALYHEVYVREIIRWVVVTADQAISGTALYQTLTESLELNCQIKEGKSVSIWVMPRMLMTLAVVDKVYDDEKDPDKKDVNPKDVMIFCGDIHCLIYTEAVKRTWPCIPQQSQEYERQLMFERESARTLLMNAILDSNLANLPCVLYEKGNQSSDNSAGQTLYDVMCRLSIGSPDADIVLSKDGRIIFGNHYEIVALWPKVRERLDDCISHEVDTDFPIFPDQIVPVRLSEFIH